MGLREKAKRYRNASKSNTTSDISYPREEIRKQAIQLFLKSDVYIREDESKIYSLGDELTLVSKNKSIQIVTIVILFLFIILLSTKIITGYIEKKNREVVVNIAEFSDLNLREILEAAKKSKEELEKVKDELTYLKENMRKEIERAKREFEKRQKKILSKNMSEKEKERLLAKIRKEQEKALRSITLKYEMGIKKREKYLKNLEARMRETRLKLEQERKRARIKLEEFRKESEKRLSLTRALYEIKLKKQRERFEKQKEVYEKEIRKFKSELERQKRESEEVIRTLKMYQKNLESLKLVYSELLREHKKLKEELEKLNTKVNIYLMYLNNFVKQIDILMITENVDGYVFMKQGDYCYVVVNSLREIGSGYKGAVFNKKGQLVAKIMFEDPESYKELRVFKARILQVFGEIYPTYLIIIEGLH